MVPLEPNLRKTICLIGKLRNDDEASKVVSGQDVEAKVYGTGFFLGYKDKSYCLTAKHVVCGLNNPVLVTNHTQGEPRLWATSQISERGDGEWIYHPNLMIDMAAIRYRQDPTEDILAVEESRFLKSSELEVGMEVVCYGFPSAITPRDRIVPFVRQGCIGSVLTHDLRINEEPYPKHTILLDATISPGNSGGPVFTRPQQVFETDRIWVKRSMFCGIVNGHITSLKGDQDIGVGWGYSTDLIVEFLDYLNEE